jgi:hypothetical protein
VRLAQVDIGLISHFLRCFILFFMIHGPHMLWWQAQKKCNLDLRIFLIRRQGFACDLAGAINVIKVELPLSFLFFTSWLLLFSEGSLKTYCQFLHPFNYRY